MRRHVTTLPLPKTTISRLQQKDVHYCEDLEEELELPDPPSFSSTLELWQREATSIGVPVFHQDLDHLLGGGLPSKGLCLITGAPGVGKTTLCLQLCCDVQMPRHCGGAGGRSLFISTDSGFSVERLNQIANGSVKLLRGEATVKNFLSGVFVAKVFGINALMDALNALPNFLKSHKDVRLVIVDSYSFPFLCEEHDTLKRTQLVHQGLTALQCATQTSDVTVVFTVQLTTVVSGNDVSKVVPALGEGLRHRSHMHLLLDDDKVFLIHSPNRPRLFIPFEITGEGFR